MPRQLGCSLIQLRSIARSAPGFQGRPGRAEHGLESERAVDGRAVHDRPCLRHQSRLDPGSGGQAHLDRLAIRPERSACRAGSQHRDRERVLTLRRRQTK